MKNFPKNEYEIFAFLEEMEMIEVKQGPYCGDQDKVRFNSKIKGEG